MIPFKSKKYEKDRLFLNKIGYILLLLAAQKIDYFFKIWDTYKVKFCF